MRADPLPDDFVLHEKTDSAVPGCDSRRVNRLYGMDLLEVETGMAGVLPEQPIYLSCSLLDGAREFLKRFSETPRRP
jgi:hypothetical protein